MSSFRTRRVRAPSFVKKSAKKPMPQEVKEKRKAKQQPAHIKASLTPGAVGIILVGPYAGKRVVILKAMPSGFVAVTGPYEVNRVPLRLVHQRHLVGTSTKLDVSSIDVSKLNDALFKLPSKNKFQKKNDITEQPAEKKQAKQKRERPQELKQEQEKIEKALVGIVKKTELIEDFLKTRFSLRSTLGLKAHELKF